MISECRVSFLPALFRFGQKILMAGFVGAEAAAGQFQNGGIGIDRAAAEGAVTVAGKVAVKCAVFRGEHDVVRFFLPGQHDGTAAVADSIAEEGTVRSLNVQFRIGLRVIGNEVGTGEADVVAENAGGQQGVNVAAEGHG
ncbi:MAG: hypothetical protein IKH39_04060 [Candidatus Methanomethylophilaceae archaeon]|nr:hypothetical protein [Candidatus Methanomethylophilaceae archaeon]